MQHQRGTRVGRRRHHGRLHVMPGADHFPFLEPDQRDAWAEAVLAFLETGA